MKRFCLLLVIIMSSCVFFQTKTNERRLLTNEEMLNFAEELANFFEDKAMLDKISAIKEGTESRVGEENLNKIEHWKLILSMTYYIHNMTREEKDQFVESVLYEVRSTGQTKDKSDSSQFFHAIESFNPKYYYRLNAIVEKDDLELFIQWFDMKRINDIQLIHGIVCCCCQVINLGTVAHLAVLHNAQRILAYLILQGADTKILNNFGCNILQESIRLENHEMHDYLLKSGCFSEGSKIS